jgi:hypothetical protein
MRVFGRAKAAKAAAYDAAYAATIEVLAGPGA